VPGTLVEVVVALTADVDDVHAAATGFGILVTAFGVGMGAGMGLVSTFLRNAERDRVFYSAMLGAAACLFVLAAACAVCSRRMSSERVPHGPTRIVVPAMFLASALPGLFVWPAFHWSADALITTGMLLYTVAAWCAYVAFEFGASVAMRRPS